MKQIYLVLDLMEEIGFEEKAFATREDAVRFAVEECKKDRWIKEDYQKYFDYEVEEGETPLTFEEWILQEYVENEDCSPLIKFIEFVEGAE